jgi:hypothetical protein
LLLASCECRVELRTLCSLATLYFHELGDELPPATVESLLDICRWHFADLGDEREDVSYDLKTTSRF